MSNITKSTVSRGEYIPLWKITQARKRFPNHDWKAWEDASLRLRKNQYKSEDERMKDQGIADQGTAIIKAESHDYGLREITPDKEREEMLKVVKGLYSKEEMDNGTMMAIVEIAKGNHINPAAPNALFAFKQKVKQKDGKYKEEWVIGLGYQSYISIAHQKVKFFHRPPRYMTPDECKIYKVGEDDLGVIVEFYRYEDMQQAAEMKNMGLDVDWHEFAIYGIGKWRKIAYSFYDKDARKTVEVPDSIPNTWDEFQVAAKRAAVNGCRKLGIVLLDDIPNTTRNDDGDYVITSGIQESAPSLPSTIEHIEGEIQPEPNETPDSAPAIESPAASESPDVTPDEAPAPAPENAGSVAKDTIELFDRIGRKAMFHRKHEGGKDIISEAEAQQKAIEYDGLFALVMDVKKSDATIYRKAFLNAAFSTTSFKSIQVAQLKALDDWSAETRTADVHAEIQMFREWHDANVAAEQAKAKSEESES